MEKINRTLKGERGFTLIELMIATVVMVIALAAVLMANTAASQTSEVLFQRTVATQDANQVIEQMRSTAASGTFPGNVVAAFPNNTARPGFQNLTALCGGLAKPPLACTWPFAFTPNNTSWEQVVVTYADPAANPLDVTVTVVWLDNSRRNATASLRSLVTQR